MKVHSMVKRKVSNSVANRQTRRIKQLLQDNKEMMSTIKILLDCVKSVAEDDDYAGGKARFCLQRLGL